MTGCQQHRACRNRLRRDSGFVEFYSREGPVGGNGFISWLAQGF
jgi:hypothetical protein